MTERKMNLSISRKGQKSVLGSVVSFDLPLHAWSLPHVVLRNRSSLIVTSKINAGLQIACLLTVVPYWPVCCPNITAITSGKLVGLFPFRSEKAGEIATIPLTKVRPRPLFRYVLVDSQRTHVPSEALRIKNSEVYLLVSILSVIHSLYQSHITWTSQQPQEQIKLCGFYYRWSSIASYHRNRRNAANCSLHVVCLLHSGVMLECSIFRCLDLCVSSRK